MARQKYWENPGGMRYWLFAEDYLNDPGHLLIAGTTGSGKSVAIDDILWTMTAVRTPGSARYLLIDPKRVSLKKWNDTPFSLGYASENRQIIRAMDYAINLMMDRFKEMDRQGVDIYQGPAVYVVIDELGDLMTTCRREFLPRAQRLLQLGRAAKVFCIMGSQSPSRKVLCAELLINVTHRLGLRCKSAIESRQVIGMPGCESLPRYGQGYWDDPNGTKLITVPMTSRSDIEERVRWWSKRKAV